MNSKVIARRERLRGAGKVKLDGATKGTLRVRSAYPQARLESAYRIPQKLCSSRASLLGTASGISDKDHYFACRFSK